MSGNVTYRAKVREVALDHYGYVTTEAAKAAGVPAVELPKLAARGGLENVTYGLYRVPDIPTTRYDQFAEALLRAGDGSYLYGETVLALLGLADVNPRRLTVAVRRRTRPRLPAWIDLHHAPAGAVTVNYEGLESQAAAEAIVDCRGRVQDDRLRAAAQEARDRGLLTTIEWRRVQAALKS